MKKTTGNLRYLLLDLSDKPRLLHKLFFCVKSQLAEFIRACSKDLALIRQEKRVLTTGTHLPDPGALADKYGDNAGQIDSVFQIYISA